LLGAFAAGLVAAGLLLHLLDAPTGRQEALARGSPVGVREVPATVDPAAVAELARRVRALEGGGPRGSEGPVPRAAEPSPGDVVEDDAPTDRSDARSEEERRAEEEARADRRFAFLTEQVRAEPMDRSWAPHAVEAIESATEDFPGSAVQRIDCRSTLCQVEVEHDDRRTSDRFTDYFFPRVPSLPRGALRRLETPDGRPRSLVILARQGHALPRWEE